MKFLYIFLLFMGSLEAMQMVEQKQEHKIVCIDMEELQKEIQKKQRQISDEREQRRYTHKKKLALMTLATAVVSGVTVGIVYLSKS